MGQEPPVIVEKRGNVTVVWFNRPRVLNAFNRDVWRMLARRFQEACSDEEASVVILRGRGGVFSSGDDIREMYEFKTLGDARGFFEDARRAIEAIALCPKPVIMVVERLAVGGGAELLLLADIVVAVEDSWISYPEARLALIPPILSTLGARILGYKQAKRLAITCEKLNASQAQRLGIVDLVVPAEKLEEEVARVVGELKHVPRQSIRVVKETLWRSLEGEMSNILDRLAELTLTDEAKMAMHMFISRRRR